MDASGKRRRKSGQTMWRTKAGRVQSAARRLRLAKEIWGWQPHPAQARFFACPAQIRTASCGRRWGKTEALSIDIATLALDEMHEGRGCRQLIVAPTDAQARLLGDEVAARLLEAWEWRDADGQPHPWIAGREITVRQRPCLRITLGWEEPGPLAPNSGGIREEPTSLLRRGPSCEEGRRGAEGGEVSILFRTAGRDGRNLRGWWAHRVVVDEASRVPDTVLTEVLLPMLADKGGDYVLASSPAGRRSAYYRLFAKGIGGPPAPNNGGAEEEPNPALGAPTFPVREGKRRVSAGEAKSAGVIEEAGVTYASFQCPTWDNPHISHAFLQAQRDELGEAMFAQEFGAEFVDDFGAVFRDEDIDAGIADLPGVTLRDGQVVSEPSAGRLYALGIDWGRKLDYTVVAVVDATERPARLVFLQRWQGTGWEAQAREVGAICARFQPWRILADGNSIGDPLAETLQTEIRAAVGTHLPRCAGTPPETGGGRGLAGADRGRVPTVERFTFGAESKAKLIDRLNLGLSARAVQYPAHRVLLNELRGFEYGASGSSGRARMGARSGTHDDVVIALALAWWAAPEGAPAPMRERILLGSQLGAGRLRG